MGARRFLRDDDRPNEQKEGRHFPQEQAPVPGPRVVGKLSSARFANTKWIQGVHVSVVSVRSESV